MCSDALPDKISSRKWLVIWNVKSDRDAVQTRFLCEIVPFATFLFPERFVFRFQSAALLCSLEQDGSVKEGANRTYLSVTWFEYVDETTQSFLPLSVCLSSTFSVVILFFLVIYRIPWSAWACTACGFHQNIFFHNARCLWASLSVAAVVDGWVHRAALEARLTGDIYEGVRVWETGRAGDWMI